MATTQGKRKTQGRKKIQMKFIEDENARTVTFSKRQVMATTQGKRKTQGRKKIQMKFIEDENARTVTFSKRRVGLFKKATELSILCGTQIAIIIFSPSGRAFTFGHPTIESIVGIFFNRGPIPDLQVYPDGRRLRSAFLANLKKRYDEKVKELADLKKKSKELESALESSGWITNESLNQMDVNQLQNLKLDLEKLRYDMNKKMAPKKFGSTGPSQSRVIEPYFSKEINLADIEGDGRGGSLIPADWLKI